MVDADDLEERTIRRESWGFDRCCEKAFDAVCEAWRDHVLNGPAGEKEHLRVVASALAHGLVAPAFAEYVLEVDGDNDTVASFATELTSVAGPLAAAGIYPCATEAEYAGRTDVAESGLRIATLADPEIRAGVGRSGVVCG